MIRTNRMMYLYNRRLLDVANATIIYVSRQI
jgi:hypothetical protein